MDVFTWSIAGELADCVPEDRTSADFGIGHEVCIVVFLACERRAFGELGGHDAEQELIEFHD